MKRQIALIAIALIAGCTPAPVVTQGSFKDSFTLTMQRGSAEVVVKTADRGKYRVTNHQMDHPMGRRPDTEAVIESSGGTFKISDRNLDPQKNGVVINEEFHAYEVPGPNVGSARTLITIDEKGKISSELVKLP